jgi:predicted HicB family RNase H-like nuclease
MKRYLLSLPEEVHAAAKVRAAQEQITLASLIQRAILAYLGNEGGPSRQNQKRRKTK